MENLKNYLFELCSEYAPSGREELLTSLERLVRPMADKLYRDRAGNLIAVKYSKIPGAQKIMLDAHADEVGLIVTGIDGRGFIHFANHTGIDDKILPACAVTVLALRPLPGVVATLPPHLLKDADSDKTIKSKDMVIDIGYDEKTAKELVKVGDFISLRSACTDLQNGLVLGKSFDNRASCAVLIQVLSMLCSVRPRFDVYMVFSAAEEFGGYGAHTAAFEIAPDEALILDTTFAVSPYTDKSKGKELGGGCAVGISPMLDTHMTEAVIGVARSHAIPYQTEVMSGKTGTDADSITPARDGVPCALLSIPLRYMHSAGEIVALADMENTARLILGYVEYRGGNRIE